MISKNKISFSEKVYRFCQLPPLESHIHDTALIVLTVSRQVIWNCRNLTKHESKTFSSYTIAITFLNRIKFRILVDISRMEITEFNRYWTESGFGATYIMNTDFNFDKCLEIETYFKPVNR